MISKALFNYAKSAVKFNVSIDGSNNPNDYTVDNFLYDLDEGWPRDTYDKIASMPNSLLTSFLKMYYYTIYFALSIIFTVLFYLVTIFGSIFVILAMLAVAASPIYLPIMITGSWLAILLAPAIYGIFYYVYSVFKKEAK